MDHSVWIGGALIGAGECTSMYLRKPTLCHRRSVLSVHRMLVWHAGLATALQWLQVQSFHAPRQLIIAPWQYVPRAQTA